METKNIFNQKVSFYQRVSATVSTEVTIADVVRTDKFKSIIENYRKNFANKRMLPCFTPSGIFSERGELGLIEHNGIMCIDVDKKDNLDVENFTDFKELIVQIPYVAYCGCSCGGKGYFLLIPIKYTEKHKAHFKALYEDFERCDLKIDRRCSDVCRLRFVSFDSEPYINENAVVYTRLIDDNISKNKMGKEKIKCEKQSTKNSEKIQKLVQIVSESGIDITEEYVNWRNIGAALASEFGEDGRQYFHDISCNYQKYKFKEADKQYSACLKMKNISIGTLFYLAKEYGIEI